MVGSQDKFATWRWGVTVHCSHRSAVLVGGDCSYCPEPRASGDLGLVAAKVTLDSPVSRVRMEAWECGVGGCWISSAADNCGCGCTFIFSSCDQLVGSSVDSLCFLHPGLYFCCFLYLEFPASRSLPVVNLCSFKIKVKNLSWTVKQFAVFLALLLNMYVCSHAPQSLVLQSVLVY